jgi:PAS domain S-box-containing protein
LSEPAPTVSTPSGSEARDVSAERFHALLQHANDLVYSIAIDPDLRTWKLLFLSERIFELSGCRPDEFQESGSLGSGGPFGLREPATHPFELIHPEDVERTLQATRRLSAGESVTREYRIWNRAQGVWRWVEDRSEPEKDAAGQVVGIWGIVRDVTRRREKEDQLAQLAAIVAASEDPIVGLDGQGRILSWNPAAGRLYGFEESEVLGRSFFELVDPERAALLNRRLATLDAGRFIEEETVHWSRDGKAVSVSLTASATAPSSGRERMFAVVVRDLSARKQLELELFQAQKMEAVGRLAGGIAHDFNNILTVILGQSDVLIDDLGSGRIPDHEDVQAIREAASRAASLTRQLLAYSRKQLLQPRRLTLGAVVEEMREMTGRLLGEDMEIELRLASTGTVEADPTQLQQVLMNLAVNARDAMPSGGRLLIETADVVLDADYALIHPGCRAGSYAMLAVSDTGVGMDRDTLRKAFEPFFTTKSGGTGLGLSTVYGIVKQSGGNVWAYAEPGTGTTIRVYLPRIDVEPLAEIAEERPALASGGEGTILVAEDQAEVRHLVRRMLEGHGYRVLEAADGASGCRIVLEDREHVDLILADLVMPRMGGVEMARRIRRERTGIPVLYTSGYTEAFVSSGEIVEGKGERFLQKPFTRDALLALVQEMIERDASGETLDRG